MLVFQGCTQNDATFWREIHFSKAQLKLVPMTYVNFPGCLFIGSCSNTALRWISQGTLRKNGDDNNHCEAGHGRSKGKHPSAHLSYAVKHGIQGSLYQFSPQGNHVFSSISSNRLCKNRTAGVMKYDTNKLIASFNRQITQKKTYP